MKYTPTNHSLGVNVYCPDYNGETPPDRWIVIDRSPCFVEQLPYQAKRWYNLTSYDDDGNNYGAVRVEYNDIGEPVKTWGRIPSKVRGAIIADHPEWEGSVWAK